MKMQENNVTPVIDHIRRLPKNYYVAVIIIKFPHKSTYCNLSSFGVTLSEKLAISS